MRRTTLALLAGATLSTSAWGQHKLYLSDVLDEGEVEVEGTLNWSRGHSASEAEGLPAHSIRSENRATYLVLGGAYGFAQGLELLIVAPYYVKTETVTESTGRATDTFSANGIGDVALRLKYRLYGSRETPTTLAARVSAIRNTGEPGTGAGSNAYVIGLYGSMRLSDVWRPYSTVSWTRLGSGHAGLLSVLAGVYYAPSQKWHIDTGLTYSYQGAEKGQDAIVAHSFQVNGVREFTPRWYVRAGISSIRTHGYQITEPVRRHADGKATVISVGFYRLFDGG